MSRSTKCGIPICAGLLLIFTFAARADATQQPAPVPRAEVVVPADVALSSLMALGDGYLQKFADSLTLFASTTEARSADWDRLREPLGDVAARNISALVWFALPDGSYWSVQQGKSDANLSDRPYFPHVLAGETVIGPLVVSRATGKCSAIVAVPVRGDAGAIVGVLGASVYLDQLSSRIDDEMAIGEDMIFFSFDAAPLLALEWDPQLIFVDPMSLDPEIRDVFQFMLSRDEGTVRYRFRNEWRTVLFRRSQATGWWYAFGVVGGHKSVPTRR